MNCRMANEMDFVYGGQARFNDLPKWAKDEQLYNCNFDSEKKRNTRKFQLKQLSMFLF